MLAAVIVVSSIGLPLMAGTALAQESNTTATEESSSTVEACENPTTPEMDQARLYAPQKTITAGQAGRIDGGFRLSNTVDCPVKVAVTLRVPSGMSISGGSDWQSSGAGMVTNTFTMQPESGIKDLSANVYSERTGQLRVTGDIEYWPAEHPEMSQEIDGITFNFDVQEPNPPDESNSENSSVIPNFNNNTLIPVLIFSLIALGMVGMMYVAPKVGVELRK